MLGPQDVLMLKRHACQAAVQSSRKVCHLLLVIKHLGKCDGQPS